MPEKYTYLLVDFLCIVFPFAFSFHPRIRFDRQWKYFLLPCVATAAVFVGWDIVFTQKGVWAFNPVYLCGAWLFGLPLEEYLFFICIPYACVFTWYCISLFFDIQGQRAARIGSIILVAALLAVACTHTARLYTSVTFLLLSVFFIILLLRKAKFLPTFYLSFFIILFPFFISNGVLTGSFLAAPVVLYNNVYNLGIRMFTIPVEDTFYGMLLMLMNVSGFQYLKRRASLTKVTSHLQL